MPDRTPPPKRPWSRSSRPVPQRLLRPALEFMRLEAAGGIVLLAASVAALVWANLWSGSYQEFWTTELTLRIGDFVLVEDLKHVVNDGLMALFFLVIGLEVKRELIVGELAEARVAVLPFFAALGGIVLPAAIFLAVVRGGAGANGWGVPIATDVAFALAALAAIGSRVPRALVAFLLGVAVIDDIAAILVVAVYYTESITIGWLGVAILALVAIFALQRIHVRALAPYVVLGLVAWFATFESGVHATIAGVAIGLLTPARPFQRPAVASAEAIRVADATADEPEDPDGDAHEWRRLAWVAREAISPLARVEHSLHQWSSFVVLPLFALANVGIVVNSAALDALTDTSLPLAIVLALVIGKTLGLTAGVALAVRLGLGRLPDQTRWRHILGVGALAGIGFTVSLFISGLAFDDPTLGAAAKLGVLIASIVAATLGTLLLRTAPPPDRQ